MQNWWYWVIALTLLYVFFAVELAMNGGEMSLKNQVKSFWEEFLWASPAGRKYRGDYVREMIATITEYNPRVRGFLQGYSYEEIAEKNLYEQVGTEMLPGPINFYLRIFIALLWPLAVAIWALLWILAAVLWALFGEKRLEAWNVRFYNWWERRKNT